MRVPVAVTLMVTVGALVAAACNDPFAITASIPNTVDTLDLYAANQSPVILPSGYIVALRARTRPGVDAPVYNFDFIYRLDPVQGPQLVPFGALARGDSVAGRPGLLATTVPFDSISLALQTGYETSQPVNIAVGSTLYVRSAVPNGCVLSIPYYAKIQVLSIDETNQSIKFRILVDINCGYRGLTTGVPTS
jgi:hypothetical protein